MQLTFTSDTIPDIRPDDTSGFAWTEPTALAAGGDSILTGGEVDSLIFTATQTGPNANPAEVLHAGIEGVEVNSEFTSSFDTEMNGSGEGTIAVQDSAKLVIQSTTLDAPNAPEVNTGQTFRVAVEIANNGGAAVQNASYSIDIDDTSVPQAPTEKIAPMIAGGGGVYADTLYRCGRTDAGGGNCNDHIAQGRRCQRK